MNKNSVFSYLLFLTSIGLFSCNDIFERDLSNEQIVLLSPGDSAVLKNDSFLLNWEELEGVEIYWIQIAEPNFDSIYVIILDSVILNTKIETNLEHGKEYQWRVLGENYSSSTKFSVRNFSIDTTKKSNL